MIRTVNLDGGSTTSSSPATSPAHCSDSPAQQRWSAPKKAPPQHKSPNSTPDWRASWLPSPAPDTPTPTPPPAPRDRVPPAASVSPPCCWVPPPPPERTTSSTSSTSIATWATPTWSSPAKAGSISKRCRESCLPPSRSAPHQPPWSPSSAAVTSTTTPRRPDSPTSSPSPISPTATPPATRNAPQNYCTTSAPTSGPATPHTAESAPIAHTPIEAANFRRVPVVPANLQAVCCRLDHQPSLPAAAVGPCRDLTAAVGIPARRGGVMTGFVASQYIRRASVRRNYLR